MCSAGTDERAMASFMAIEPSLGADTEARAPLNWESVLDQSEDSDSPRQCTYDSDGRSDSAENVCVLNLLCAGCGGAELSTAAETCLPSRKR